MAPVTRSPDAVRHRRERAAVRTLFTVAVLLFLTVGPASAGRAAAHAVAPPAAGAAGGSRSGSTAHSAPYGMGLTGPLPAPDLPCCGALLKAAAVLAPLALVVGLAALLYRERTRRRRSERRLLEFLATAGHELRTPLTAISGYVQLARLGGLTDTETFELAMERTADETRRMAGLLDELMLLTRIDLGQPLRREPVNLAMLCREAAADARACSPRHPIRVTILPGTHMVVGDRDRLYQAVANLLANVRHHTPEGTRTSLGLGTEAGFRVIEVTDDGPGIPMELRRTAFERFVHGGQGSARHAPEDTGTGGGNGLGLSVVAAIVAAHGGTVTLQPGGGAWFRIQIPA
ncbi:sensor histidine kinase [Streptomyces heilongjiangensis]|uniref:histidine kinase n=1 Tax=Streptomyces heilongjiangensis TaxID=945052 RepID=A0ABW1BJ01_9ACTN|nr:HAMP domain-containing sensor histidine kinase [Streptomyces heilongjiangensis]MDC2951806.1 HAMP domain-containing sensor histidine kinase [Streptomyces heilongjiangensis]